MAGSTLREQLAEVEAQADLLRRRIEGETCSIAGHVWKHIGGKNAGCGDACCCSVPVHTCALCGDSDYGDNDEADAVLEGCERWPNDGRPSPWGW